VGLFDQFAVKTTESLRAFASPKIPPSRDSRLAERPVLRLDRVNSWESSSGDDLEAKAEPEPLRRRVDHGASISQLPPRYPGAPMLRIEHGRDEDASGSSSDEWVSPALPLPRKRDRDHAETISQLPPRYPGAPMLRIERLSHFEGAAGDSESSEEVRHVSHLYWCWFGGAKLANEFN